MRILLVDLQFSPAGARGRGFRSASVHVGLGLDKENLIVHAS